MMRASEVAIQLDTDAKRRVTLTRLDDVDSGGGVDDDDAPENANSDVIAGGTMRVKLQFGGIAVAYFGLGTLVYTQVEGWTALDSVYFIVASITTVGYGDMSPVTDLGKMLCCLLVLLGVAFIGAALIKLVELFLDAAEALEDELAKATGGHIDAPSPNIFFVPFTACADALGMGPDLREGFQWFAALVVMLLVGAVAFCLIEGHNFVDGIYFAVITCTSVGYGDMSPATDNGKIFCIFYMIAGTLTVGASLKAFVQIYIRARNRAARQRLLESVTFGAGVDVDGDGEIDRTEFILFKLEQMQEVDSKVIAEIAARFDEIDKDGSGSVDRSEIAAAEKEARDRMREAAAVTMAAVKLRKKSQGLFGGRRKD